MRLAAALGRWRLGTFTHSLLGAAAMQDVAEADMLMAFVLLAKRRALA